MPGTDNAQPDPTKCTYAFTIRPAPDAAGGAAGAESEGTAAPASQQQAQAASAGAAGGASEASANAELPMTQEMSSSPAKASCSPAAPPLFPQPTGDAGMPQAVMASGGAAANLEVGGEAKADDATGDKPLPLPGIAKKKRKSRMLSELEFSAPGAANRHLSPADGGPGGRKRRSTAEGRRPTGTVVVGGRRARTPQAQPAAAATAGGAAGAAVAGSTPGHEVAAREIGATGRDCLRPAYEEDWPDLLVDEEQVLPSHSLVITQNPHSSTQNSREWTA